MSTDRCRSAQIPLPTASTIDLAKTTVAGNLLAGRTRSTDQAIRTAPPTGPRVGGRGDQLALHILLSRHGLLGGLLVY